MSDDEDELLMIDPEGLDEAQRSGNACAVCHKVWPRPEMFVGRLPDQRRIYTCRPCASTIPTLLTRTAAVVNALENTQPAAIPTAPADRRVRQYRWRRRPLMP